MSGVEISFLINQGGTGLEGANIAAQEEALRSWEKEEKLRLQFKGGRTWRIKSKKIA